MLSHPLFRNAPLEFNPKTLGPNIPTLDGDNGILSDLDRFLLIPVSGSTKVGANQASYIREFGAAFDAALKPLIEAHPEPVVRINAARLLAYVARTGAPAFYPTVTALLANPNTPTGVKYYMFHAAAGLLAAGDVNDIKLRKHAADPPTIGALVKAVEDCITNPAMLYAGISTPATPDQLAVIGMVRRQAVIALAHVKFVMVPGPDGKTPLYPAYTLARVALGDPALVPPAGPAEAAEAAIGICNMAPVERKRDRFVAVREYNADVAVEAVTAALVTFASPRAANAYDKSLPWRTYALRLGMALRDWQPLFDPDYDLIQPTRVETKLIPPAVKDLYNTMGLRILAPMDKVDVAGKPDLSARVDIEWLRKRLADMRADPNRKKLLFTGVPQTSIDFAVPKK